MWLTTRMSWAMLLPVVASVRMQSHSEYLAASACLKTEVAARETCSFHDDWALFNVCVQSLLRDTGCKTEKALYKYSHQYCPPLFFNDRARFGDGNNGHLSLLQTCYLREQMKELTPLQSIFSVVKKKIDKLTNSDADICQPSKITMYMEAAGTAIQQWAAGGDASAALWPKLDPTDLTNQKLAMQEAWQNINKKHAEFFDLFQTSLWNVKCTTPNFDRKMADLQVEMTAAQIEKQNAPKPLTAEEIEEFRKSDPEKTWTTLINRYRINDWGGA